jgi:uncharacterized protein YjbJ (UPF0337 family)
MQAAARPEEKLRHHALAATMQAATRPWSAPVVTTVTGLFAVYAVPDGVSLGTDKTSPTERNTMGNSGPEELIRGIVEDVVGKAKEIIGIVANRDGLREEGRAQQDKAKAARDVAKKEAEAESSRAAEKAAEARQKASSK